MKQETLRDALERYLETSEEDVLSRNKESYLKLLENLEKLGSTRVDTYRNGSLTKLILNSKEWMEKNPKAFLQACQTNPITALLYCPKEWLTLDEASFLENCETHYNSVYESEAVELWAKTDPKRFLEICDAYGGVWLLMRAWQDTEEYNKLLVELCEEDPYDGFEAVGDLWAKADPQSFLTHCEKEPKRALRALKSITPWKTLDPAGFWKKVDETIDNAILKTKEHRERVERYNPTNPFTSRGSLLAGDVGINSNISSDLMEVLKEERPDMLVKVLPYLYNNLRGEAINVVNNSTLWQEMDKEHFLKACLQNPREATLALGQLGEAGRKELREALLNETNNSPIQTPEAIALMDALNGEGLEDPALIQDALDNSQGQLRVDRSKGIKNDRSQQAILWEVEQSLKVGKLQDAITALHVEDLLLDPTLVKRLCELTPEMPYLLFQQALIPIIRRNNISLSARHIEALFKLLDLYRKNQELLTKAVLEGKEIEETDEVLLGLTLDDEQTLKLVTYGIQTPGVAGGTLAWAARRAGNLEGGPKVKLARRGTTAEGRSVS